MNSHIKILILLCITAIVCSSCAPKQKNPSESNTQPPAKASETISHKDVSENEATEAAPEPESEGIDYGAIVSDCFSGFGGNLSYSLHMYDSGYTAAKKPDTAMKSASVIKLFIMEYAYDLVRKGEISTDTLINGRKLSSLIESMITVSDNTATNILIDHFTMPKLNEFFASCNYGGTKLQRRMLDTAAAARGEENYTTAKDVMAFLDKLYANKDKFPQKEMLSVMKRQQISTKLRRNMPPGIEMASKTGELSDTENDIAIVFTPNGDYALVCLTGGGSASAAKDAMAKCCREIYDILTSSEE